MSGVLDCSDSPFIYRTDVANFLAESNVCMVNSPFLIIHQSPTTGGSHAAFGGQWPFYFHPDSADPTASKNLKAVAAIDISGKIPANHFKIVL